MKKNYFKKIASVAAASAVLTAAAANLTAVSAAAGDFELIIDEVKIDTVPDNHLVQVEITVGDATKYYADSIGLTVKYDSRLEYSKTSSDLFLKSGIKTKPEEQLIFIAGGPVDDEEGEYGVGAGTSLLTLTFKLPDDAKAGDVYPITWVADPKMNLYNTQDPTYANTLIPYEYNDGFIQIGTVTPPVTTTAAPVTTTPAPVTTTPAPVTTTAAPVTTTPVPVTTVAPVTTTTDDANINVSATTTSANMGVSVTDVSVTVPTGVSGTGVSGTGVSGTSASTTKSTKDTQKSSPNTGSSANGVAALAATMVVAAGAAVALKKKKD